MLKMDLEYNQGILFVRLKGILNNKSSYKINNYLNPVLKKHKIKYLIYNCYFLKDIDEVGLDAILNTKIEIKNNQGKLAICELSKELKSKFNRLKITKIKDELDAFKLIEV